MDELRKQICDVINASELPLEAKKYVVRDICREIEDVFRNEVIKQQKEVSENE